MKNDRLPTIQDLQSLSVIAESIYREATNIRFEMAMGNGWDVLEEDDGELAIFYIWVRVDCVNGPHWFTRFKLPEVLENPEQWFREDADKLALAIAA